MKVPLKKLNVRRLTRHAGPLPGGKALEYLENETSDWKQNESESLFQQLLSHENKFERIRASVPRAAEHHKSETLDLSLSFTFKGCRNI